MRDYPATRSPKTPPPTELLKNREAHKIQLMSPIGCVSQTLWNALALQHVPFCVIE